MTTYIEFIYVIILIRWIFTTVYSQQNTSIHSTKMLIPNFLKMGNKTRNNNHPVIISLASWLESDTTSVKRRLKGINKCVTNALESQDYFNCLLTGIPKFTTSLQIRYENRVPYVKKITKNSISSISDKSYQLNFLQSLPYHHPDISEIKKHFQDEIELSQLVDLVNDDGSILTKEVFLSDYF